MDLRTAQATESRNTATALRHMEAFCRGASSTSGTPHHRPISEQDRAELAKTRQRAEQMARRHGGEIAVLRGEQSRRMGVRIAGQEREMRELEQRQSVEIETLHEQDEAELRRWREETDAMRKRLRGWWDLQIEIWRRLLEKETGVLFDGVLLGIEWPADDDDETENRDGRKGEVERRDTLHDSPTSVGAERRKSRSRDGSSSHPDLHPHSRPPSSSALPKELAISTSFTVRSGVVGRA